MPLAIPCLVFVSPSVLALSFCVPALCHPVVPFTEPFSQFFLWCAGVLSPGNQPRYSKDFCIQLRLKAHLSKKDPLAWHSSKLRCPKRLCSNRVVCACAFICCVILTCVDVCFTFGVELKTDRRAD